MQSQIRGMNQANRNTQDGISIVQRAEGGIEEINSMLHKMRELSVQGANGTLSFEERQQINKQIGQLQEGIDSVVNNTDFNKIPLLKSKSIVNNQSGNGTEGTMNSSPNLEIPDISTLTSDEKNMIQADLVFVIDHTGSMGSNIENIIKNIDKFIESFQGTDISIGLVTYADDYIVSHDLGMSREDIKSTLENLQLIGGFEYALDALKDYAQPLSFRAGGQKHMVLVTDEAADSKNGYNITDVANELNTNGFKVDVIAPTSNPGNLSILSTITGGINVNIYDTNFTQNLYDITTNIVEEAIGIESGTLPTTTVTENPDGNIVVVDETVIESPLIIQIGANEGEQMNIKLCDCSTQGIGVDDVGVDHIGKAEESISKIDEAIDKVSSYRGRFGSYQNRLEHIQNNLANTSENLTSANSRIQDIDISKEIIEFTKTNILNKATESMLVHSKTQPETVLQLLK